MSTQKTRTRLHRIVVLLLSLGLALTTRPAAADEDPNGAQALEQALQQAREVERDLVGVLADVTRATVTIVHHARLPAGVGGGSAGPLFVNGAGSGVLVSYRGTHVVTNAHVVAGAKNIEIITSDGRHIPVSVRARDEARDLALLQLPKDVTGLEAVALKERATTELREGAWVLATGNPFMLAHDGLGAATLGVFSGARAAPRKGMGSGSTYLLQHDAEINPGNSGGPLWSRRGDLLGINGAIVTRSMQLGSGPSYTGTSISVPIPQVRRFLDRALAPTKPARATATEPAPKPRATSSRVRTASRAQHLGLNLRTSVDAQNRPDGALVIGVTRRSALRAQRGQRGLQSGDRITQMSHEGQRYAVRSRSDFDSALTSLRGARQISIHYVRGRQNLTWSGALARLGDQ